MATGALIVGLAFLLLAAVAYYADGARAPWLWLAVFFIVFTFGELFILPTGLGLFARLSPPGLGATTIAAWFVTIFSGSLFAGVVGTLWSRMMPAPYFMLLSALAMTSALLLRALDRPLTTLMKSNEQA